MTESIHKDASPSVTDYQESIIDKKPWKWESVLLHLVAFAPLMPPAWQAISACLLAFAFIGRKGWRSNVWSSEIGTLYRRTFTIIALTWALLLALGVIGAFREESFAAFSAYLRLIGKQGIWGAVVIGSMLYFQFQRERYFLNLKLLLAFASVLFLYCVAQRYTGIHWVHGFDGRLGEHRFAYGVYRVSGFMDHPLTFAFNLMLMTLFSLGHAFATWRQGQKIPRKLWSSLALVFLATLSLTDSRFPLALTLFLVSAGIIWQLPNIRFGIISALIVSLLVAGVVVSRMPMEKLGRWGELVDSKIPLEQRFDRILFWKVNWQLGKESPALGAGLKSYDSRLLDTYERAGYTSLERKYNAHNIYLQTFADSGIVGVIALFGLLFALLRLAVRVNRSFHIVALPLIVLSTLASGVVQNNLRDSEFLFALWITIGLSLSWSIVQGKPDGRGNEPELEDLKS